MQVREATPDDAAAIAVVHVDAWQWGYRGLLSQAEIDRHDVTERTKRWRELLPVSDGDRHRTLVAEDAQGLCGFVYIGPARDADAVGAGEVYALYVAERVAGRGVGHALLTAAHTALARLGFGSAVLWVLGANARARAFYVRQGWAADGTEKREHDHCGAELQVRYRRAV